MHKDTFTDRTLAGDRIEPRKHLIAALVILSDYVRDIQKIAN